MNPDENVLERLTRIETAMELGFKEIERRFEAFERYLVGNGQPGVLRRVETRLTDLETWRTAHSSQAVFSWRLLGLLTAGTTALVAILQWLSNYLKGAR